jgi:WD40 repeat protein
MTLAFSAGDQRLVMSINRENRLQEWSLPDGKPVSSARGPYPFPTAAAVSPDGTLAVSGTAEGVLKLWSTHTGVVIAESAAPTLSMGRDCRISSVAFSADGRNIVSGDARGITCVWRVPEPEKGKLESRPNTILSLPLRSAFPEQCGPLPINVARFVDETCRYVVTGAGDLSRIRRQDQSLMQPEIDEKTKRFDAFALLVDLSNPGAPGEKVVAATGLTRGTLPGYSPVGALAAAVSRTDGRVFVGCGGPDYRSSIVHSRVAFTHNRDSKPYSGHSEAVLDVAVSPDGKWLATASADNTARVWAIPVDQSQKPVELRGHSGDVASVTFSPDGDFVLTVSRQDGTARIWDRDGGDATYVLGTRRAGINSATLNDPAGPRQYTDDVVAAAFSPDGKLLVTGHGDGNARIYRLELCGGLDDLNNVAQRRLNGFND